MTILERAVDSIPRRDPTRSAGVRRAGRGLVNRRVFGLHRQLRQLLQDHDLPGLKQNEDVPTNYFRWVEPAGRRLERSEQMLRSVVERELASPPDWLKEILSRAIELGVRQAGNELQTAIEQLDLSELKQFHAGLASIEVKGISGETQRRVLRHIGTALETNQQPAELMREVRKTLEKITRFRLLMLVNTSVVRALNAAKLFIYAANGITRVGIEPEWLPRRIRHDSMVHDQELVNVLTAGDDDVCEDCEDIAGDGPYEIDEARALIPAHPNCRCAFVPADDERFAESEERLERIREEEDR
jgi:hypothetical protein